MFKKASSVAVVVSCLLCAAYAAPDEAQVVLGREAWRCFELVGNNPYGDKKSYYARPLEYVEWGNITVHSRGSDERNGAEEKTQLVRFDLSGVA